jgi:hypothetical protein
MEPVLEREQCGFKRGTSITDVTFTLQHILEKNEENSI